ncbi:SDR family NAD(P)-dependent oxidoreductase [Vallicoccus soli]|uniref:SDR family NAD(P)-dependent oxidoreductase n=1 Tax=Vallicoccus soli TaxID=2339232 RepID=A0A3A3ZLZ9_9ACTN|nr:SDR family NAD(P)-dependent oxidoreductase [Vallicoccus soli]RJK97531.1 SDR family NAD(P)-dependent oxidoreductase [Vallicoccus soli]
MSRLGPYAFAGGTAIVTGAAGGIGEALAEGLARRGSHLVLLDRQGGRLGAVAAGLRARHPGLQVATRVVDLADRAAAVDAARAVAAGHPGTTLVVSNAGVALAGRYDEVSLEDVEWVLDVNLRAAVVLTHALVPVLRRNPGAHLVTVSSVYGLVAPAGQAAYAASKFGLRGLTEALRHELAGEVGVTCVHPGGVATRIAATARVGAGVDPERAAAARAAFARLLTIAPRTAAEAVLRGVERRRPRVLVGASARVPDLLARAAPASYGRALDALSAVRVARG